VLGKEPGTEAQKQAFLDAELPRIQDEAIAQCNGSSNARAISAKTRSLIIGWYRQRQKGPPHGQRRFAGRPQTAVEAGRELVGEILRNSGLTDLP
jgi:hypothetical protein